MTHAIFVYGTLKNGHQRNSALRDQRYLGTATTQPNYKMFRYGSFPALVEDTPGYSVLGEIYEVTDSCLVELDEIEGTKYGLFSRRSIELKHVNLTTLPLYKRSSDMLLGNSALAYFFVDESKISGLKDCGQNWTLME